MICSICNVGISTGEDIKCKLCNEYLHFACAGFREAAFRKASETSKNTWVCSSCKPNDTLATKQRGQDIVKGNFSKFSTVLEMENFTNRNAYKINMRIIILF